MNNAEIEKAFINMKEGIISKEGFLGNDERSLSKIISADEKKMKELNISFELISKKMEAIAAEAKKGLGEKVIIESKWEAKADETRGYLNCPFSDEISRKNIIEVINIKNSKKILFSELSIHLMKVHHFLQGNGSIYRLDPKTLKEVLG